MAPMTSVNFPSVGIGILSLIQLYEPIFILVVSANGSDSDGSLLDLEVFWIGFCLKIDLFFFFLSPSFSIVCSTYSAREGGSLVLITIPSLQVSVVTKNRNNNSNNNSNSTVSMGKRKAKINNHEH